MTITLRIPGEPLAMPRAKAVARGEQVRMYTPTSRKTKSGLRQSTGVAEYKALMRCMAAEQYTGPLLEGPVRIDCLWVFQRTKGMMWKKKPMPRIPKSNKPDRDNLDKMVLDSLTGVILSDDDQVVCGYLEKVYAAGDEQPHTLITIETLEEGQMATFRTFPESFRKNS